MSAAQYTKDEILEGIVDAFTKQDPYEGPQPWCLYDFEALEAWLSDAVEARLTVKDLLDAVVRVDPMKGRW